MIQNQLAFVTGAGSGIGRAVAEQLGAAGYHLALIGRSRAKLEETAALTRSSKSESLVIAADVADGDQCRRAIAEAIERFGRLDALANVAGFAALSPIAAVTEDLWRSTIDTNLSAIVHLTAAAWPHLQASRGIVVNVSSMASIDPFPHFAIYAAAKAAVNMFTRCTASEGTAHGIRAVAVAPGAVETPMLRSLFDEAMIPASKTLPAGDVARMIVDCITGKRRFTAGETIVVPSP